MVFISGIENQLIKNYSGTFHQENKTSALEKYLELTLDLKLIWNRHVEKIASKARSSLMVYRNIAGKTWGCNPSILRWMSTMIVRPMITYGAVVWYRKTELTTTRKTLEKVQRQ